MELMSTACQQRQMDKEEIMSVNSQEAELLAQENPLSQLWSCHNQGLLVRWPHHHQGVGEAAPHTCVSRPGRIGQWVSMTNLFKPRDQPGGLRGAPHQGDAHPHHRGGGHSNDMPRGRPHGCNPLRGNTVAGNKRRLSPQQLLPEPREISTASLVSGAKRFKVPVSINKKG